jgi:hypothetical protein
MRNQFNATNCLERRMGHKEQRLKIAWGKRTGDKEQGRKLGKRGRETRNKEVRYGTEGGRKGTKKLQ